MIAQVTQENLYLFVSRKVASVVERYATNYHLPIKQVLMLFYTSQTYARLSNECTNLWRYGVNFLYNEFCEEMDSTQSIIENKEQVGE